MMHRVHIFNETTFLESNRVRTPAPNITPGPAGAVQKKCVARVLRTSLITITGTRPEDAGGSCVIKTYA